LVVAFKRQFNEAVYWLTGAARKRMRKISRLAAADRKLWFGHGVPHRLVGSNIAFVR
jgi:lipid II:glycine glycyltransferase (peptidoglycan interpeptide bridge formation enzyme)